ncbi:MAG: hypothetical protein ABIG39_03935 [Candidatus Micrarchaeota archaeon]
MMIGQKSMEEYIQVMKMPGLIYVAWAFLMLSASFTSFDTYVILGGLALLVYLFLGCYVGWVANRNGFGIRETLIAGMLFGGFMGLLDGVAGAVVMIQNNQTSEIFSVIIEQVMEDYSLGREEAIQSIVVSSILFSPLLWGLVMCILSTIGFFIHRYFWKTDNERVLYEEPPPKKRKRRMNKRFKRK